MGLWQSKNQIPELNDVTLSGTVSIGNDLGSGAYGKVFSVQYREKSTDKTYAAKQIHPVLIEGVNPEDREAIKNDFVRECLRCSVIHHPNIVEFVGVYYSNQSGIPIMVMELMETSLNSFIENNKSNIAIETKISILFDVSCGLTFLHTRKPPVIHRDLSSKNVMLTSKLVAKIGDLGLAKVIRSDRTQTKSKLSTAPGCLDFMPPETLVADPVYSFPVDVFSFAGITLHVFSEEWPSPGPTKVRDPETGKYVAPTEAGRRQQYLDKMTGGAEVTSIRQLVERCLDDDPDERPPIQEVKEMIEPMVDSQIPDLKGVTLPGEMSIGNELGRGAYGKVYSIQYHGKTYAAKEIHPILLEGVNPVDREAMKIKFIKECHFCSTIHHSNIVEFVGVYYPNQSDMPIMVMELMETSLVSFVKKNKSNIAIKVKLSILFDVSCGLTFLHTRVPPVIHRNISPNNVMLTSKLVAKIGGMGVAKVIRANRKCRLTTAPGCLDFMPPETFVANPEYGFPVDVFSFAGIVLHVFSEEWPSPGPTKVQDLETGKYVAPTEAGRRQKYLDKMTDGDDITTLRQLVERCLDDDPDERAPIQEVKEMIGQMVIREEEVQHGSRRMSTNQKKTDKMKKVMKGKSRATVQHPKYSEMITAAVVSINEQGGCSRQKILKYIGANYEVSDGYEVRARLALNQMVRTGALIQTKGTGASGAFKLANKSSKRKTSKTKKSPVKKTTKK